jgi:tetratricopeptide (TPR) repeat protein
MHLTRQARASRVARWLVVVAALALVPRTPLVAQKLKIDTPLDQLQHRASVDSTDAVAHFNLAMGYMSRGKWPEAESSLGRALVLEPQFAEAQLGLAVARMRNEKFWEALDQQKGDSARRAADEELRRMVTRAFLIDPLVNVRLLALTWRVWGNSRGAKAFEAFVEGDYAKAHEGMGREIAEVMKRQPRDSVDEGTLWMHALASGHLGRWDDAEQDLQSLIAVSSAVTKDSLTMAPLRAVEYRYMLAAVKQRKGDFPAAIDLYQRVLTDDISNFMAHVQLARIHEAQRDYARAIAERMRAIEVNPSDATLKLDLAVTQGKAGRFDEAVQSLHEAAAQNPLDARPHFWLGVAYAQLGKAPESRAAFARFVETAPSRYESMLMTARQRLEAGS